MKYRALGDKKLLTCLENAAGNANYRSGKIQNEIINIVGDYCKEKILENLRKAKFFSIEFDETMDVSKSEQITIFVRYLDVDGAKCLVRENFAGFVNAFTTLSDMNPADKFVDLTGQNLGRIILKWVHDNNLDHNNIVSIITDGAFVMTSERVGAVKYIKGICII